VFVSFGSWLFLGEVISVREVIGVLIILAGLVLVIKSNFENHPPPSREGYEKIPDHGPDGPVNQTEMGDLGQVVIVEQKDSRAS